MKTTNKIFRYLLTVAFAIASVFGVYAQEYDDMYFNGKDRKKQESEKKAIRDSVRKAEEALMSKNINPDYMDRLDEYEGDTEGGYYEDDYVDNQFQSDRVDLYDNNRIYTYSDLDDIYWSNPVLYRNTVFDPFYRSRLRTFGWASNSFYNPYNRWDFYDPYDYYYGGVRISVGWTWGNRYVRPWNRGWGYNYYDPFCVSPWGYNSYSYYGNSWGSRNNWGYYGNNRTTIIVNNFENDNGLRRGRRVSRGSSYGRIANNSNGSSTGNIGRRPSGGRVADNTNGSTIPSRRTSSYNRDSRNTQSGRVATNSMENRGTRTDLNRSRGTYEDRNMRTYSQLSDSRTLQRNSSSDFNRAIRNNNTDVINRTRTNTNSFDRTRTNGNSIDRTRTDLRSNSNSSNSIRTRSNYGINRSSNSNSTIRNSSYHRSNSNQSSGINRSTNSRNTINRSGSNSSKGYTPSRSSNNRSSGFSRSNSSSSRSSGMSRSNSSSNRSSGMSRSSSSSSRSSGSSSKSSGSSRTSSRRGGN